MPGLDYWDTETFLKQRGVPLNYAAADLEADTCMAFGQAAFRYLPESPIERHTFVVLGWADAERRRCGKKDAVFAVIRCGWKMLLPLHPNGEDEP